MKKVRFCLEQMEQAPIDSREWTVARELVGLYASERDNVQLQLDKLKLELQTKWVKRVCEAELTNAT